MQTIKTSEYEYNIYDHIGKQGTYIQYESDAPQLKRVQGEYFHNKKIGLWRKWHKAVLIQEGCYNKNGMKEGLWKLYNFHTGALEEDGAYVDGKKHGIWRRYNSQGEPLEELVYDEGVLELS